MKSLDNYIARAIIPLNAVGYYVSYFGVFLILFWVGIFKFTQTEAELIRPLVENNPLTSWLYNALPLQTVSNLFGIIEILTALLLLVGLKCEKVRLVGGVFVITTFTITISFLFTTPGIWKTVEGILITDFFILKDLVILGFGCIIMTGPKQITGEKLPL